MWGEVRLVIFLKSHQKKIGDTRARVIIIIFFCLFFTFFVSFLE
jgi:hypothetical protein